MSVIGFSAGVGFESIGERVELEVRSRVGRGVTRLGEVVIVLGDRIEQSGCWTTTREMQAHRAGYEAGRSAAKV